VVAARAAHGRVERLPELVRELLDAKPEVIVTFGTTAAQAAKAATTTTPIVMHSLEIRSGLNSLPASLGQGATSPE
jgi:ABC-type uncharacterized transport system substrate-binding protein